MKEIKECNLCKSKKIKPLFRLKDRLYAIEGKFCFSICKNCGLIFQNPLLSDKEWAKYLDIGCGDGSFLKLVKKRGMEPHGVDLFIPSSIQELNIKNISL